MRKFGNNKLNIFYQIIGLVVLCVATIMLALNTTLSWFRDQSITSTGKPNIKIVGTISLDITTNFNFYNLALAPDTIYEEDVSGNDIGTYLKTTDEVHNIDGCFVRIKFESKYQDIIADSGTENKDFTNLSLFFRVPPITSVTADYASDNQNKWAFDGEYYYYLGIIGSSSVTFNDGYAIDNQLTNDIESERIQLTFTFEAIQRQYGAYSALWEDAPNIFNTYAQSVSNVNRQNGGS